jgi:site-specific DNA recombinase
VVAGPEPYGYRHVRDDNGKVVTFEVHESEAKVVRMIYSLYVEGDGTSGPLAAQAIAKRLSALGVATPGERRGYQRKRGSGIWDASKILRILSHELYAGRWKYGVRIGSSTRKRPPEEHIVVEVPAIVDRPLWDAAQMRKKRNKRMAKRNKKREYLLSGLIRCGCGWAMCGHVNNRNRVYYRCSHWRNRHAGIEKRECYARAVRADAIEPDVWESLVMIFSDLKQLEDRLLKAQAEELEAMAPKRSDLEAVNAMIAETERDASEIARELVRQSGAVKRALELEAETVNSRHEKLITRQGQLQVEISQQQITDTAIRDTVSFAADMRQGLDHATFSVKRRLLETLDLQVTVSEGQFWVESSIGKWSGEIRTLPKAWEKDAIADDSPT